jgi:quercetin dioxygenase-like cupin family protein
MEDIMSANQVDDIVAMAPEQHKVLFENDQIRMLKVTVKPGDKVGMHTNPENVNYILKSGKLRFTNPDGSTQVIDITEGQVIPAPVGTHAVENIGNTEVQTIGIELKD